MMDELKPCPFCGLKPKLNEAVTYPNGEKSSAFVRCPNCGLAYSFGDKNEQAVSRWNTRPIEDALHAERDAAVARVAELEARLKSAEHEVHEILLAALSGDCQKYLNYDLDGNKYCKWGVVEKDIRAVFEKGGE